MESLSIHDNSSGVKSTKKTFNNAFHSWLGSIHSPSNPKTSDGKEPSVTLSPSHVLGFRSHDSRNNLFKIDQDHVVYPSAALGVVQNTKTGEQKFFNQHTDDIVALTIHPDDHNIIATGQLGKEVIIYIWNAKDLSVIAKLSAGKLQGVASLSFSPKDGKYLLAAFRDDKSTIQLWDWKKQTMIKSEINSYRVFSARFSPFITSKKDLSFVSFGEKHINFWTIDGSDATTAAAAWTKKKGILGTSNTISAIHSYLPLSPSTTVFGANDGTILVMEQVNIAHITKSAYNGPVMSLCKVTDQIYASAGDGKVSFWSSTDHTSTTYHGHAQIVIPDVSSSTPIRSLRVADGNILVGTQTSDIVIISFNEQEPQFQSIAHGHGGDVNCAFFANNGELVTSSADETVRIWKKNGSTWEQVEKIKVGGPSESVTLSPDTKTIVVGLNNGYIQVYKRQDSGAVATFIQEVLISKDAKKISVLKFSPDGSRLAIGSHNDDIVLANLNVDGKLVEKFTTCSGHKSAILHIDWSVDGNYLQSNCEAYELLFWDAKTSLQITQSHTLKDTEWATWSCKLGWPVQGIWSKGEDGSDINSVYRSNSQDLLVTGDDTFNVNLFKYPVNNENTNKRIYKGHSSHVTSVMFSKDDKYIVTTGSGDRTIIIWSVQNQ
ncbi:hypothetical protein DFA_09363 [Cavenderia fasciculata]|uniref:HELP domain-containing protein n=1 Tax=Cavenderia fasciculata TaxID=261658 RepID=F4Q7F1_CACFS|nr:uncharacterized protein DFA_09363 [Cavenderia fasciculata]EGG16333.1 hypothetical protein DFA_09363 [Cavenderia fasciculata]|eukprot:XP_004354717.1 hypothetical protein DFA_09363 [Cavenderia fasciculata]